MFPLSSQFGLFVAAIHLASTVGGGLGASTLCVTVRDFADLPLPNAWVNAVELASNELSTTNTNREGTACFTKLKEGYYSIEVGLTGFLNVRYSPIRVMYPVVHKLQFRLPFSEIREGDMGIAREAEAVVSGTLRSRDKPVDGATICVTSPEGKKVIKCVVTNDLGEYALALPPGVYRVELRVWGATAQASTLDVSTPGLYRNRIAFSEEKGK